jgi:hypothetical protein
MTENKYQFLICQARRARASFLLVLLLTSGCSSLAVMSHVPLSTLSRLATLKVEDVDPDQLRVAARLPSVLEPRPQGAKVQITVLRSGATSKVTESFTLEPVTQPTELAPLAAWEQPGAHVWLYRLMPADVVRLRYVVAEGSAPSTGSSVSISAGVDACHRAPLGSQALPATTLLRVNRSGYFVLVDSLDLRSVVSDTDLDRNVPGCAAP